MRFSKKLKSLRENKSLTQESLANDLHISRSLLAKYELGLSIPDETLIREIAKYFDVQYEDLLGEDVSVTVPYKFIIIYSIIHNIVFYLITIVSLGYLTIGFAPVFYNPTNSKWFSIITGGFNNHSFIGLITFIVCFFSLATAIFWKIDKNFTRKMILSLFMDALFYLVIILVVFSIVAGQNGAFLS